MYSWEISNILSYHNNSINSQIFIDICNSSPQIIRIKYDPLSNTYEMWDKDNYWHFQVYKEK